MKIYVVIEYAVIEYEECSRVMSVFSSEDKAAEAILEYEKEVEDSPHHYEYMFECYDLDKVWQNEFWEDK